MPIDRYSQDAVYFVKFTTKLKIGLSYDDLNTDLRKQISRNNGVIVKMVYKDTPAFAANLIVGDVIIIANGNSISDMGSFKAQIDQLPESGILELRIIRNGKELDLSIPF